MKKAILFSLLSMFLFGCESYHRNTDIQEQQEANQQSNPDVRPMPQSGPEHGGDAGSR